MTTEARPPGDVHAVSFHKEIQGHASLQPDTYRMLRRAIFPM